MYRFFHNAHLPLTYFNQSVHPDKVLVAIGKPEDSQNF